MYLVTGATGHIGNVLTRKLLERGEKVRALILPGEDTTSLEGMDVEKVEGDVLKLDSLWKPLEGASGVFHLAGIISIMPGENPLVRKVNVEGTLNVLKAAKQAGVGRLMYTSSIHALTRVPHGQVVDESVGYDPDNPYGAYDRSKAEATLEVQKAASEGLDAVIICPTGVIGPYDFLRSMMGDVIRTAALHKLTPYVEGSYDFVDVRDVADGILAAFEKGRTGESYILSGQRMSVHYLLETVREVTGRNFPSIKIPFRLAEFAARFTPWYYLKSKSSPRFTPYSLEVLQSNSVISHAKASHELGYHPRPLQESIADAVHWFKDRSQPQSQASCAL